MVLMSTTQQHSVSTDVCKTSHAILSSPVYCVYVTCTVCYECLSIRVIVLFAAFVPFSVCRIFVGRRCLGVVRRYCCYRVAFALGCSYLRGRQSVNLVEFMNCQLSGWGWMSIVHCFKSVCMVRLLRPSSYDVCTIVCFYWLFLWPVTASCTSYEFGVSWTELSCCSVVDEWSVVVDELSCRVDVLQ